MSVYPNGTCKGKRDFLGSHLRFKCLNFLVKIPLANENLFYNNFVLLSFFLHNLVIKC